jgi:hypothetical protein
MDKGFNDDELADIMSEIESLEQEFASDDEVVKAQEPGLDEVAQSVAAMVAEEENEDQIEPEVVEEVQAEDHIEPVVAEHHEEEVSHDEPAGLEQAPVVAHNESSLDSGMNEVLEELTEMSVADIVPEKETESFDENIHHMKIENEDSNEESVMTHTNKPSKTAKTAMSFSVEGDMKLDLSFLIGGNEVQLHVTEEGLEIELEGGAKFTLPVHGPNGAKQAA